MQKDNQKNENKKQDKKSKPNLTKQIKILSGFYPVFIYLPVKFNLQTKQIQTFVQKFILQKQIKFQSIKQKHITLTKTINILPTQVQQYHKNIQKRLKNRVVFPIILLFKKLIVLQNFICLQVQKICHQKFKKITQIIGQVIKDSYFQNPIYHVSLFKLYEKISPQIESDLMEQMKLKMKSKSSILLNEIYMNSGIKKIKFSIY